MYARIDLVLRVTIQRTSTRQDVEKAVADERLRIVEVIRQTQAEGVEGDVLTAYQRLIQALDEALAS